MPQQDENAGWRGFLNLCEQLAGTKQLAQVLDLMFTAEEKHDMAKRMQIVTELLRGEMTQRQMADELNVSIAKITRGSNSLKTIDQSLRRLLEQHLL